MTYYQPDNRVFSFGFCSFDIVSDFGFRASDFQPMSNAFVFMLTSVQSSTIIPVLISGAASDEGDRCSGDFGSSIV